MEQAERNSEVFEGANVPGGVFLIALDKTHGFYYSIYTTRYTRKL